MIIEDKQVWLMARERETQGKRRFFTLNSLKKWQSLYTPEFGGRSTV